MEYLDEWIRNAIYLIVTQRIIKEYKDYINWRELEGLTDTLEESLAGFYEDVLGIEFKTRVIPVPYLLLGRHLEYSIEGMFVSESFLVILGLSLKFGYFDTASIQKAGIIYLSLNQLFDRIEVNRARPIDKKGKIAVAWTLMDTYSSTAYLKLDEIIRDANQFSTPDERLLVINDVVTRTLLDEEQLKHVERFTKLECKYGDGKVIAPESPTCSVMEKVGISKFLEDLRKAVSDPNNMDRTLIEYAKFLK